MKSCLILMTCMTGLSMCLKVTVNIGQPQSFSCSPEGSKWEAYGTIMFMKSGTKNQLVAICERFDKTGNGIGRVEEHYKNRWNVSCSDHNLHLLLIPDEDDLGYYFCNAAEDSILVELVKSDPVFTDNPSSSSESTSTDDPSSNLQPASADDNSSNDNSQVPLIIGLCLLVIVIVGIGIGIFCWRNKLKQRFQRRFHKKKHTIEVEPPLDEQIQPMIDPTENGAPSASTQIDLNDGPVSLQEPTGISAMDRDSLKNLSIEETMQRARKIVQELEKFEEYHHGEEMRFQRMLEDISEDCSLHNKDIGDTLSEVGYAAMAVKKLKTLNTMDIFKDDVVWLSTYYTYYTLLNFSDAIEKFAKDLGEAGAVSLLTFNCGHKPYLDDMQNKRVFCVVNASMAILYNMSRNPDVKHHFKKNKTVEVLMPFINTDNDKFKARIMLILAYITEEEENSKLIDETGTISNVVKWIEMAMGNRMRRCIGFSSFELTQGLAKLAVNDANKIKIIDEGALPLFVKMLEYDDAREQSAAARCVWTLSKDKDVREKLLEHEGLVPVLEKLQDSSVELVAKNAKGALCVIKGENDPATMPSFQH